MAVTTITTNGMYKVCYSEVQHNIPINYHRIIQGFAPLLSITYHVSHDVVIVRTHSSETLWTVILDTEEPVIVQRLTT